MNILPKFSMAKHKAGWALLVSFAGLLLFFILGICLGATTFSLSEIGSVLYNGNTQDPLYRILIYVRLPRVLGAFLAGCGLSVAGAIIQSVLNNPLASPNIIGVNTGAGLLVLLVSAFFPGMHFLTPLAAFLGALLTSFIILAIAVATDASKLTLVLTGFAISSIWGAGMNLILILYPDAYVGASTFLVGGLASLTLDALFYPAIYIGVGLTLALLCGRELNILSLGEQTASSLGMNVKKRRIILITIAAVLAGAAVSFAGLIGFVGLIVPHAVRFLIGHDHRWVLPICALAGGAFVILCDLLARTLFAPYELPVGILLSFIGGPFFVILIIRNRRKNYA